MRLFAPLKKEGRTFGRYIVEDFAYIISPLFLAIVLVGICLRVIAFGNHTALHSDEALYADWAATIGYNYNLLFTTKGVDKPPLFYYLNAVSQFLFEPTDQAAKLPGLLIGCLAIPLVALIATAIMRRRDVALWAAFLFAFSPIEIAYAPTVFADPLCLFFCLSALLALLYQLPLMTGVCIGLALATKQSVIFFIPLYFILYCIRFRLRFQYLKAALTGFLYIFVPFLLWIIIFAGEGFDALFGIYQPRFVEQSAHGFSLFSWLAIEKFVTGNWLTFLLAQTVIISALVVYALGIKEKRMDRDPDSFCEIIALFLFTVVYTLWLSFFGAPLYPRYVLVISSIYIIVAGISASILTRNMLARLRYVRGRRLYVAVRLLMFVIVLYWVLKVPDDISRFSGGSQYRQSGSIKPCVEYIKSKPFPSYVFYTEELWPWLPWYFHVEKQKDQIQRSVMSFRDESAIAELIRRIRQERIELANSRMYFILKPAQTDRIFDEIENQLGKPVPFSEVFAAYPTNTDGNTYAVYAVDYEPFLESGS